MAAERRRLLPREIFHIILTEQEIEPKKAKNFFFDLSKDTTRPGQYKGPELLQIEELAIKTMKSTDLDLTSYVSSLRSLINLLVEPNSQLTDLIKARLADFIKQFDSRDLSNTMLCFYVFKIMDAQYFIDRLKELIETCNIIEFSKILKSLVGQKVELPSRISERIKSLLDQANPEVLVDLLKTSAYFNLNLEIEILAEIEKQIEKADLHHIAEIFWYLAKNKKRDHRLLDQLKNKIVKRREQLRLKDLSKIVWAVGYLGYCDQSLMARLTGQIQKNAKRIPHDRRETIRRTYREFKLPYPI